MTKNHRPPPASHRKSVWATLFVSADSEREIHRFFIQQLNIPRRSLCSNLHITIYHARREIPDLSDSEERVEVLIEPHALRFMVMAPGGENPRSDIDPSQNPIGIRIKRDSLAIKELRDLRSRFYRLETVEVLGSRKPSSHTRNAFGARYFQPHITLLRPGGTDRDLAEIGAQFRETISPIRLDRFVVTNRAHNR